MRVTESIAELRRICQQTRENAFYRMPWLERHIQRKASIYITKLFLQIRISANQATTIGLVVGLIGGALLTFPSPVYWFIGIAVLWLFTLIAAADGEVARYNKASSAEGAFWNSMSETLICSYAPACAAFGIWQAVGSIWPLVFGLLAVLSFLIWEIANLLPYPILYERGELPQVSRDDDATPPEEY